MTRTDLLHFYLRFGLIPIPLRPRSSEPLVKWRRRWNPTHEELEAWASRSDINWAVRCGENLAVIDCDCADAFHSCRLSAIMGHKRGYENRTVGGGVSSV